MPTLRHLPLVLLASSSLVAAGCATLRSADRRSAGLDAYLQEHPIPRSCDALWPDALRVAAGKGFPLSGRDRKILGETDEGLITGLVSAGTQTYRTDGGGLLTSTDWNRESGTRLRIQAQPSGPDGCRVRYDVIAGGVSTAEELEMGPDWELSLELLRVVDPASAAKAEAGVPASR